MRVFVIAFAGAMLAWPASAQTVASVDTELVKGRCRIIADDGEVGDYTLKRCPGLGGARVYVELVGQHSISLSFRWGNAKATDAVKHYSIGTRLEWRGIKDKRGFSPYAAIIRVMIWDNDAEKTHDVLAVLRMEKRNACLMAAVDEEINADAMTLARAAADTDAPSFPCVTGKPRLVGTASRWAKETIGAVGEPPK